MTKRRMLLSVAERARVRRFLNACERRLGREGEYLMALSARWDAAATVEAQERPETLATLNATVRVRNVESGKTQVRSVVLPTDMEILAGRRDMRSWPGPALLGARVGDEVRWYTGGVPRRFLIEKILFQPERSPRSSRSDTRRMRYANNDGAALRREGLREVKRDGSSDRMRSSSRVHQRAHHAEVSH